MSDRDLRGPRSIRPEELGDSDYRELREALAAGRRLDESIDDVAIQVDEGFTGRVMAALDREPSPGTVGFVVPIRRRGLIAGFGESLRQAWAAIGSPSIPSFARATALAYVLVVALAGVALAGTAALGVGGALGILGPEATQMAPSSPGPTREPGESFESPGQETEPAETNEAGETDGPSDSPGASDDHGGSTGEPGEDGSSNSGPGSSSSGEDGSGSGSGSEDGSGSSSGSGSGSTSTPDPTSTPRPSSTPKATGTPKPSETPH
jgi:hypothetical protein